MRVLLVNLGAGDTDFMDKGRVFNSIYRRPYLGVGYLTSYLKAHGHSVDFLDARVEPTTPEQLAERVRSFPHGLVGFFAIYVSRQQVLEYVSHLKSRSAIPVVIGGPDCYNDKLYLEAGVDYVVNGEGEVSLLELVEHLEGRRPFEALKGLSLNLNGSYVRTPDQPLISDLDSLPFPDRSQYPIDVWHDFMDFNMRKPFTTMITSRGCPYSCDFCESPTIWRRRVRQRSAENVLTEVDEVVRIYGVRYLVFSDDIFGIPIEWHREFCTKLAARNYDLNWFCLIHPLVYGKHTEERIELMARAGCRTLHLGVQSSHEEVLSRSGRYPTELLHHKRIFAAARSHGMLTFSTFIHGLPGDTPEVFESNRRFAKDLAPHYVLFVPLKILAGTRLEEKLAAGETQLPGMSFQELVRSCRRAELEFYASPKRTLRLITYILRRNPTWFVRKAWYAIYMILRTFWIGLLPAKDPRNRDSSTVELPTSSRSAPMSAPHPISSGTAATVQHGA